MALNHKPLNQITAGDLQALVDAQVPEKRTLDYKAMLPGNADADKKEFLADVSSFANAAGGYLIFGIAEGTDGLLSMPGLAGCNADQEILRLEQIALQGVEPRIPGLETVAVPLTDGCPVIVMRIPRSWAMPHRISFKESDKFYSRRSAGKFRLDMGELRAAFAQSDTLLDTINNFRAERLSQIVAGLTPTGSAAGVRVIIHLVPLNAFDPYVRFDLSHLAKHDSLNQLIPMGMDYAGGFTHVHNYEGFVSYTPSSYTQVFRNGSVEAVSFLASAPLGQPTTQLRGLYIENTVLYAVTERLMPLQRTMNVEMPMLIMLSVLGVQGFVVVPEDTVHLSLSTRQPINRDALVMANVMVESYNADIPKAMRPIFDVMWNASGWPRSQGYDDNGNRVP